MKLNVSNVYTIYTIHTIYANFERRIRNTKSMRSKPPIRSFLLAKLSVFVIWSSCNGFFDSHPLNNTNRPNLPSSWHVLLLYPCAARFGAIYTANSSLKISKRAIIGIPVLELNRLASFVLLSHRKKSWIYFISYGKIFTF